MPSIWRTAGLAALVAASATAATAQQQPGEPRVRDLEYRVRDLTYRSRALDNSERVEQSAEQTTVTLAADVLFAFDKADLTPAARSRLDELASDLDELGPRTVTITGHTDARGEPAYNLDLSQRRAGAVRDALAGRLGGDFTFEVTGRGEDDPVAPNENADGSDNPEGRALNRRVEIQYPTA
jgi:outer membrane protein OmpA-like peptidoglycan-associated protein